MLKKAKGTKAFIYDTEIPFVDEEEEDITSTYHIYLFEDEEHYNFWLGIEPFKTWHMTEMFSLSKECDTRESAVEIAFGNLWDYSDCYKRELREVQMVQELNMMWYDRTSGAWAKNHGLE